MPPLDQIKQEAPVKALVIAESGSGKTGAIASLANAGFKIRILDFDNGVAPLANWVEKDKLANVEACTLIDKLTDVGGKPTAMSPDAATRAQTLLTHWRYYIDDEGKVKPTHKAPEGKTLIDLGKPASVALYPGWGLDTVLVIDSLSFFAKAAMNYVLMLASRQSIGPRIQDWGEAMNIVEATLAALYDPSVRCNVIVNTHVEYQKDEATGALRGLPLAIGNKLTPKIPRYFNTVVSFRTKGAGASATRVMSLKPFGLLELKTPLKEPPEELPIASAWADFFKLNGVTMEKPNVSI